DTVLLLNGAANARGPAGWLFSHPLEVLRCRRSRDVRRTLKRGDEAVRAGAYAAGYVSYEASYAFEPKLAQVMDDSFDRDLVWMGIYPERIELADEVLAAWDETSREHSFCIDEVQFELCREQYVE